jgi:hypothetical protein
MARQRQVGRAVALALVTMSALLAVPAIAAAEYSYRITGQQGFTTFASGWSHLLFDQSVGCKKVSTTDPVPAFARLQFPITFYKTQYTNLKICTNGTVQFGTGAGSTNPVNDYLPTDALRNRGFLAALWGDFAGGTSVAIRTNGTAPNRRFVIEWRVEIDRQGVLFHWNAIFSENDPGRIRTQYVGTQDYLDATSATIGIQKSPLGPFTQFGRVATVPSGLQLTFTRFAI